MNPFLKVVITLAEVLSDQLKDKRKNSTGSKSRTQQPFSSQSMEYLLSFPNLQLPDDNDCFICVVIHDIDGPSLRDSESQRYLARLASCSLVRMVASVDHVNVPLFSSFRSLLLKSSYVFSCLLDLLVVWDKKMVHTRFNWCWYHVPTFAPYEVEGRFFPLVLTNCGNAQTTMTALVVLQSLTPNAQSVFKILAEYQLANEKEGKSQSIICSGLAAGDLDMFHLQCFYSRHAYCTPNAVSASLSATK
ncbi:hypothetical protein B296_00012282 [Ensete ventricosum]|uniref:Origin recognition complex subunit 2 n=1 Tax=Ensete ventricosum TaxID=4639 RepID=A0A426ZGC4_ENSVE|nr:hypothetical protein B296_00012282 [Ensete ventricosum]